jgi:hypothetical protein
VYSETVSAILNWLLGSMDNSRKLAPLRERMAATITDVSRVIRMRLCDFDLPYTYATTFYALARQ